MFNQLLKKLADGKIYTAETLMQTFSLNVNELNHFITQLKSYGIPVQCSNSDDYQLTESIELLNKESILSALSDKNRQFLRKLEIFEVLESTNRYLWQSKVQGFSACLAEYQMAGRGRQGKSWISPYASGLCLSIKNTDLTMTYPFTGLNIALAVTAGRILRYFNVNDIGLKWPNDVWWRGRKLAGLLLESRIYKNTYSLVFGIGINVKMPPVDAFDSPKIDQAYVDLHTILGHTVSRNTLAGTLIDQCMQTILNYAENGLSPFLNDWQAFDLLKENQVKLNTGKNLITGKACGINEEGALLVQVNGQIKPYFYSDVSVRL